VSIYRRDEVFPEWEPIPWGLAADAADEQEQGFHHRALKHIAWRAVPYKSFPGEGIFGHQHDWFAGHDIEFYASFDGEDLVLIRNLWHGFPDPPEWGLASRPLGRPDVEWESWGHFPKIPEAWSVPGVEGKE
jgi:hypothetical protein